VPEPLNILRSRTLRLAILVLQACCPDMAEPPAHPKAPPAGDPASHCAICHFAAALSVPPAIESSPPALELLENVEPAVVERAAAVSFQGTYYGRAPPTASFHLV
jgi:hypothetical protein